MGKADLHIHTTASDGVFSPSYIVDCAVKKGLKAIAITDHDTTLGIKKAIERSNKYENFIVIPGIELSSDYEGQEVHILGYFIDEQNKQLINVTRELRESRLMRSEKIILKLCEIGINISLKEVKEISDEGYIGRPHIARVLVDKGYVESVEEAFEKYIGKDKPAYVNRYKLSLKNSIDLIHKSGGVAVLAHPGILDKDLNIIKLIDIGLDGIEVIHPTHNEEIIKKFYEITRRYNLISTGGSDYHGHFIEEELLFGKYVVDYEVVELLEKASKKYQG